MTSSCQYQIDRFGVTIVINTRSLADNGSLRHRSRFQSSNLRYVHRQPARMSVTTAPTPMNPVPRNASSRKNPAGGGP